jgi:hypothetical protein
MLQPNAKRPIVYQIRWNSGGGTAEYYSTKGLGERILSHAHYKGRVVKLRLPVAREDLVWVKDKAFSDRGSVYRTRGITALQHSELKRVWGR